MIPKIIHYVWLKKNEANKSYNDKIYHNMNTWKNYNPDFEIKEWNEETFDINAYSYIKENYEANNLAKCSDFIRLQVLYNEGGIYLDTDVECIKPFGNLINRKTLLGYEYIKGENPIDDEFNNDLIGTSVIGFEKHNELVKKLIDYEIDIYNSMSLSEFKCQNNVLYISKYFKDNDLFNKLDILDREILFPYKWQNITSKTITYHKKFNIWYQI